ncbi:TauD/TfdA family dioxygenase [Pigmentiphaga soli]|uniref:TauD/TfdA family dioxygenase n=1 Tax=Pigmentiphaga soli TaxID=1007095 RepID=A0ABP8HJ73_9BURK
MNALLAPTWAVRPLTGSIGAEIEGLDLRHATDDDIAHIKKAFLEHCVLVFRGQDLQPEDQVAFAEKLGQVYRFKKDKVDFGSDELPSGILKLSNVGKEKTITERWHFDGMYLEKPPAVCILAAKELPPQGGDTIWANQYLAYETLSKPMRDIISRLRYLYQGGRITQRYEGNDVPETAWQPAVRRHPESGRDALYVGHPEQALHFEGMTREESEPLLRFLYTHGQRPDFCYRHIWKKGDVLMWDNRCTMHFAVHDYGMQPRLMHRITLNGDVAVGPA